MPNISIRQVDAEVVKQLKVQAAEHGVSMEEEVRQILARAVVPATRLGDLAVELFSPCYGKELDIPKREIHKPLEF